MNADETACLALLREIIAKLQPYARPSVDLKYAAIKPYVADCFDPLDLIVDIGSIKQIERIVLEMHAVYIYFIDTEDCRQRAKFVRRIHQGSWCMESLKFECPICFGEGVNDGETCPICRGNGWGA